MNLKCEKFFQTAFNVKPEEAWNALIESALQFAGQIGESNLINISHSIDINGVKSVFVWYRHDAEQYREGSWVTED